MKSPTIPWLIFCLSVAFASGGSSEVNNEGVVANVRHHLNKINSLVEASNNPSESVESGNLDRTSTHNQNINSLSSHNLLNRLNAQAQAQAHAQAQASEVEGANNLRNLRSSLNHVSGVYDFTNPSNHLSKLNLLSNSHGLEGVNNLADSRSSNVGGNGQNAYEDGSSLSDLIALNRLGSNGAGGLAGLNVLARNGVSSVDLNSLGNVNVPTAYEVNRLGRNKVNDPDQVATSRHLLNQLSGSGNNPDELSRDLLEDKSNQFVTASLNKLKEDSRRGWLQPVRIVKTQLVGRSGSELDEDNLINALQRHNKGELNALSALASVSNLNDLDNLSSGNYDSNNFLNKNNAVETSNVKSESGNQKELGNLNRVQENLVNQADNYESETGLLGRHNEEELDEVNNGRRGYINNQYWLNLLKIYGINQDLNKPVPILPQNKPVPITPDNPYNYYNPVPVNPYNYYNPVPTNPNNYYNPVPINPNNYYNPVPINPYLNYNQDHLVISPAPTMARSGLQETDNLNSAEELLVGTTGARNPNNVNENLLDRLVDLEDFNAGSLLESFNRNQFNGLSLRQKPSTLKNSRNQNLQDDNDLDNAVVLVDENDINNINQVEADILTGRRKIVPLNRLHSVANVNHANDLHNLGNLETKERSQGHATNSNVNSLYATSNNPLVNNKIGKLQGASGLDNEDELTLEEARQLVVNDLRKSLRHYM